MRTGALILICLTTRLRMSFEGVLSSLASESTAGNFVQPRFYSSSCSSAQPITEKRFDLLTVLAEAQKNDIDLLPVTWQATQKAELKGGTSQINQKLVDIHTSFAFKCLKAAEKEDKPENSLLQMIVKEISAFGDYRIHDHPNVAQLLGLCWDIGVDNRVWPALIFEKSPLGDLKIFADLPVGKCLVISQRLKLCMDIGTALMDLHSIGIVHGDIKPDNVLIFQNTNGGFVAKMIDFGFSTRYVAEDDRFPLGRTIPWNAPEHDRESQWFDVGQAKKTDIFSFGMLCFWLLFTNFLDGTTPLPESCERARRMTHASGNDSTIERILKDLKAEEELHVVALEFVAVTDSIEDSQKIELGKLFRGSLQYEAEDRVEELQDVLSGLVKRLDFHFQDNDTSVNVESGSRLGYGGFNLMTSISDLYRADYRVRSNILACMQDRIKHLGGTPYSEIPAKSDIIQLALCHQIRFGGAAPGSDELFNDWLGEEGMKELQNSLEKCRNLLPKEFRTAILKQSVISGSFPSISLAEQYQIQGLLQAAENRLREEEEGLAKGLGSKNVLMLLVEVDLGSISKSRGRLKRAEVFTKRAAEISSEVLGLKSPTTLRILGNLATICWEHKKFAEAQIYLETQIGIQKELFQADDQRLLDSIDSLGSLYNDQGKWQEAEKLHLEVVEARERLLGADHPDTLTAKANLSCAYCNQGKWPMSEELDAIVWKKREDILGKDHPDTIAVKGNLAQTYKYLGKWPDALKMEEEVLEARQKRLGDLHPSTLLSMANLAQTHSNLGRWDDANKYGEEAMSLREKIKGLDHPDTLASKEIVARCYLKQGRLTEAIYLAKQARKLVKSETQATGKTGERLDSIIEEIMNVKASLKE